MVITIHMMNRIREKRTQEKEISDLKEK